MVRKLKHPLYHGTTCSNAKFIKKEGISTECAGQIYRESKWGEGEEYMTDTGKRLAGCGVYLTKTKRVAASYAESATCDPDDEAKDFPDLRRVCIVEVRCLADGAKLGPDGFGELMTDKSIPPTCIKSILGPKEVRKILKGGE